jgi:hypothetical protein
VVARNDAERAQVSLRRMPSAGSASPIALSIAAALRSGSTQARVAPERSRLTRTGTCSRLDTRFCTGVRHLLGARSGRPCRFRHRREPLKESRKNVSSAATIPLRLALLATPARK